MRSLSKIIREFIKKKKISLQCNEIDATCSKAFSEPKKLKKFLVEAALPSRFVVPLYAPISAVSRKINFSDSKGGIYSLAPTQIFGGTLREKRGSNFYGFMGYKCPRQNFTTLRGSKKDLDLENAVRAGVTVGGGEMNVTL